MKELGLLMMAVVVIKAVLSILTGSGFAPMLVKIHLGLFFLGLGTFLAGCYLGED